MLQKGDGCFWVWEQQEERDLKHDAGSSLSSACNIMLMLNHSKDQFPNL